MSPSRQRPRLALDERGTQLEDTQLDKLATQVAGPFNREYARQLLRIRSREWAFRYQSTLVFRQLEPDSPPAIQIAMRVQPTPTTLPYHGGRQDPVARLESDQAYPSPEGAASKR